MPPSLDDTALRALVAGTAEDGARGTALRETIRRFARFATPAGSRRRISMSALVRKEPDYTSDGDASRTTELADVTV